MPSDFRWHSFLVSAGYLPDTKESVKSGKNSNYMFGERPGQIHYHEPNNTKWYLDINEIL